MCESGVQSVCGLRGAIDPLQSCSQSLNPSVAEVRTVAGAEYLDSINHQRSTLQGDHKEWMLVIRQRTLLN